MKKYKRLIIYTLSTIALIIVLVIVFISPLTKYLIEKYDVKYTGRQIKLGMTYVNPFTGYVYFKNLKIYEYKNDSLFFSAENISANLNMSKLFSKTYEISQLTINKPIGSVIQSNKDFNFSDLIAKFSPKKEIVKTKKAPVHFSILDIRINNGTFYYVEKVTLINYFIKNVYISSQGFKWDVDTIPINFSFVSGIGSGSVKGGFSINSKNNNYRLGVVVNKFDLNIIGQYVKDLSNYGTFKAFLDANIKSKGNFSIPGEVTNSGQIIISDFHFGKDSVEDFASFKKLSVKILELSPNKRVYLFDSVSLNKPYFKYEKYDELDNIQTVFGKEGDNVKEAKNNSTKFNLVIEIVKYLKILSKNLLSSNYKANYVAIKNGNIIYNDYSLSEKFTIALNPLNFSADSIDKKNERVKVNLNSGISKFGSTSIDISINPKDSSDFDLHYKFQKIPLTLFNPYLIKYTSFPLDRGSVEINGVWNVRNGNINSNNRLSVIDPRLSERLKNNDSKWLPMRLIMFFVRERGNVIDYQVPIKGNLKDPKFKVRDVIFDVLGNIFIKPIKTPYSIEVRNVETSIEKSLSLKWEKRSAELTRKQEAFIKRIAKFLSETPNARITVSPQLYSIKEKEYVMFFEAKKKYYIKTSKINNELFTEKDSISVDRMSIKDVSFLKYLNASISDSLLFTVQDKCLRLIGDELIQSKLATLNRQRVKIFKSYFLEKNLSKQITFEATKNVVPFNGFSFYKIEYKEEFPDYLLKAHSKMNELNNEAPRNKFQKIRKKIN